MYLITGASGFVGSKLSNALKLDSKSCLLLARKKISGFETVICDLESDSIPIDIFSKVDTIIHLAGFAHDRVNRYSKAYKHHSLNVDATIRLANLASISGVKKFVFISSVKASGASLSKRCIKESEQFEPKEIYGRTKRLAELELFKISRKSNMKVTVLRPALVYGPDVKGNLSAMMLGIKKGWFPPLPSIDNSRSMVHIDDLVRAIILVSNDSQANGNIFNVTDGKPHSSREIYEVMCNLLGKPIPKWEVPLSMFRILSIISFGQLFDINKLFGNECYSSEKICALGYSAQRSLGEMNETIF
jgi:UDP-glucose 4-epimerase